MRHTLQHIFLLVTAIWACGLAANAQNDRLALESGSGDVGEVIELQVSVQDLAGTQIDTSDLDGYYDVGMHLNFDPSLVDSVQFVTAGLTADTPPPFFFEFSDVSLGRAWFLATYNFVIPFTVGGPAEHFCTLRITPSAAAAGQTIAFTKVDSDIFLSANAGTIILRESSGNLDVSIGSVAVNNAGGNAPVISSFSADPASIPQGGSSTLSWDVSDADSVSIDQGVGTVNPSGNTSVSPDVTTTYTISATNQFGTSTETATVTVVAPGQPQITGFSAFPTQIVAGGASNLSWTVVDADTVSISPTVGDVSATGTTSVTPAATTTYTISATNSGGTVTDQVTVTVVDALEIVSFSANPEQVEEGGSAQLSWQVNGATSVSLDGSTVAASGSTTVNPSQTTTYTLSASGALNQTDSQSVTVRVAGDAALALDMNNFDFGTSEAGAQVNLSVNAAGVYPWTLEGLPHWLDADLTSGTVDGERAVEVTFSVNRNRLFPGQQVQADLRFVSTGLVEAELSVSAGRADADDETYLYYPLLQAEEVRRSELTVANLSEAGTEMLLQVFQQDGTLVGEPISLSLAGLASYRTSPNASLIDTTAWAVATLRHSDGGAAPAAAGCLTVRSTDGEELYGLSAELEKSDFLYVPHIARDTPVFFTNSAVVNLDNTSRVSSVETDGTFVVGTQVPGGQGFFSYEEIMGAAIENAEWGAVNYDPPAIGSVVGAEVFGFKEAQRTVGVGLSDRAYNELYFVHIAEDLASFWTGMVIINLADRAVTIQVAPYNAQQELIDGGFTDTLAAGEKKSYVVLGERQDLGESASWVKITSPEPLTGYELFANPAGSAGDTFAGLESIGTFSRKLAFCHTEEGVSENGVTGVTVLNPGDLPATLNFRLVAADGTVKEETTLPALNPKEKLRTLASLIFTEAEIAFGDIILVDSDQEIAGFQLYGDLLNTMGALTATPYQ